MLATSTDGKLYRITYSHTCTLHSEPEPKKLGIEQVARLHQSGINGLWYAGSNEDCKDNELLVVTGGDDGKIAIVKLDKDLNLLTSYPALNAHDLPIHSAPLTDICGISRYNSCRNIDQAKQTSTKEEKNILYIVTCSVDQRICLWQLTESQNEQLEHQNSQCNSTLKHKIELCGCLLYTSPSPRHS